MDKIFLCGMKADTLIGVYDWERERKQTLILDLEISVPERTGTSD
ncbi:dihydroneopterin aldolase, partial [Neisseria sp. P0017.S010]